MNWQVQHRQGEVNNSTGNGEAKELMGITHGHELKGGRNASGNGGTGERWTKGENQDNCNSMINKIYSKKQIKLLLTLKKEVTHN